MTIFLSRLDRGSIILASHIHINPTVWYHTYILIQLFGYFYARIEMDRGNFDKYHKLDCAHVKEKWCVTNLIFDTEVFTSNWILINSWKFATMMLAKFKTIKQKQEKHTTEGISRPRAATSVHNNMPFSALQ